MNGIFRGMKEEKFRDYDLYCRLNYSAVRKAPVGMAFLILMYTDVGSGTEAQKMVSPILFI